MHEVVDKKMRSIMGYFFFFYLPTILVVIEQCDKKILEGGNSIFRYKRPKRAVGALQV